MIACIINARRASDAEQAPIDVLPRRSSEKQGGEDDGGDERKDAEESRQAGVLWRVDAGRDPEHREHEGQRGDDREKGRRAGESHIEASRRAGSKVMAHRCGIEER